MNSDIKPAPRIEIIKNLINSKPPFLIKWGMTILFLLTAGVLCLLALVDAPNSAGTKSLLDVILNNLKITK